MCDRTESIILITKQLRQILQSLLGSRKDSMDLHDILAIWGVACTPLLFFYSFLV
jgi:hypothetical protein